MSLSERALSLIDAVYEAGREPHGWRVAVDRFVTTVGAMGGGLQFHDTKSLQPTFCGQVGLSRESISDYVAGFMRDNPVVKASLAMPVGVPVLDWMATPKRTLMRTPIYQEWGRRNGVHGMANVVLLRDKTQFANFNLIRSPSLGDFERNDLKLLNVMAPHLRRAVEMNGLLAKMDRERYAAYAALERLDASLALASLVGASFAAPSIPIPPPKSVKSGGKGLEPGRVAPRRGTQKQRRPLPGFGTSPGRR